MNAAGVIVALVSVPFLVVLALRPVARRLALRYPRRRPVEAFLVILGSLLGTAIITGSLIVGDTVDRSIRADAYNQLGPIDELIAENGLDAQAELDATFAELDSPVIDGTLSFAAAPAAAAGAAPGAVGQPRAQIVEVDFERGREFGPDPSITGLEGPAPGPGEVVLTTDLADRIEVSVGDEVLLFAFDQQLRLVVVDVAPRRGVAGFWPLDERQASYNAIVAPGTLAELTRGIDFGAQARIQPPTSYMAFSNVGGVEDGADETEAATAAIEELYGDSASPVRPVKQDLLVDAEAAASSLTQLYFTMGMFAVIAGVLLLVNIFVMLADDRRTELGMLRAVGLRRAPLVGAFGSEGWIYSLIAAVAGGFLGIVVGRVIAWRADNILDSGEEQFALDLTFTYEWSTVATGMAVGLVISLVTVVATSVRVSRLNVIAAIRDIQAAPRRRLRKRYAAIGAGLAILGIVWLLAAISAREGYGVMIAPMLVIIGSGLVAGRWIPPRPASALVGLGLLVWSTVFFVVLGALDIAVEIPVFLVQGLAMAGGAVAIVTAYQGVIGRSLSRWTGGSLPVRLGLAYPIARRNRTAMTLAMFAVVVMTMVYLSILSYMFVQQADDITSDLAGGYGIVVTSNPTNPVPTEELESVPGVTAVAPLAYGFVDWVAGDEPPQSWPVTGFGPELVSAPPAMQDTGIYDTAEEAWAAVLADPDLVIVDEFFLSNENGPPDAELDPGEPLTIIDPVTGASRELTVAALAEADFILNGAFYGIDGYRELVGARAVPSRFFVAAEEPDEAVAVIRRQFLANGADAVTVRSSVDSILAINQGFFTLMQQFVGVGLVVGIGGIGVIMIRAVRERRREVGVLRSLGFQPKAVGRAYMLEAVFVAVEGVFIGVVAALIGTWGLVSSENNFTEGFDWGVPWGDIAIIVAVALIASAITAVWPARRASRIQPAVALRMTD